MSDAPRPLRRLGFLTIGVFDGDDPGPGHRSTLAVIQLGEQLGFDSAWLPAPPPAVRHLLTGRPAGSRLAAHQPDRAGHRGDTPGLGEPAASGRGPGHRRHPLGRGGSTRGVSVGPPMRWGDVREALYPDTSEAEDFSYERVERLLRLVRGEPATAFSGTVGIEQFSDRVQPHAAGLAGRMWYGAASLGSARWAGEHGMNLLTSSVVKAEEPGDHLDFAEIQRAQIETFRAHHADGDLARVSQGLVVIPTDTATPEQRERYARYAESRRPRTRTPQGPARMMFAPDLVGSSDQIADRLRAHAGYRLVEEVAFALPFTFEHEDYVQILTDIATRLGPALGWHPSS